MTASRFFTMRPLPVVGHLPHILRHGLLNVVVDVCGDKGAVGRLDMGSRVAHVVSHPEDLRHIFAENAANYIKGSSLNNLRLLLGEGLVTSDGDLWRGERNIVQVAFQRDKLTALLRLAVGPVDDMLSRWDRGPESAMLEVHQEIRNLVFIVSGLTLFGCDLSDNVEEATRAFATALNVITDRNVYALPMWLPTPANLKLKRSVAILDRHVRQIVERRDGRANGDDVLSVLLRAQHTGTNGTNDRQLRDEVITLYLAGHDATSHTLSWMLHFLSIYPDLQERLREEAAKVLAGQKPTAEHLRSLTQTQRAIQEAMRLRPAAAMLARQIVADDEVRGCRLKGGEWVVISSFLTHHLREFWENPDRFDPDRFSESAAKYRHPFAYYPFGIGPRTCIGNHLATMEVQLIVAMLLQRYEFAPSPGEKVKLEWHGTLYPHGGLRLIRRRLAHA